MVMTMRIRNAHIRKFAGPDFRPPLLSLLPLFDRRKRAIRNERKDIYWRASRRNKRKSKCCRHDDSIANTAFIIKL